MLKRQPRKLIRLSVAMGILQESRTSLNNRIKRKELEVVPGRGKTSPKRVYAAQVDAIAKQLGIL